MSVSNTGVVVSQFSQPLSIKTELPVPALGPKDVLVRVTIRPVNPADVFSVNGVYPGWQPSSLPAVPGLEGAGVIESVGSEVSSLKVGQRVIPYLLDLPRSWQTYVVVNEENAFPIPDNVSDVAASQFVVNPFTAWAMLFDEPLKLTAGQTVIQTAAGSALGRMVINLAKRNGIKTINVVRRQEQVEELKAIGADHVIVSANGDGIKEQVLAITNGKGADAALDSIGSDITGKVVSALAPGKTLLIYGAMSGIGFNASIIDLLFRDCTIKGFWVTTWYPKASKETKQRMIKELFEAYNTPGFADHVGEIFPLEKVNDAVAASQVVARGGKVFLQ